MYSIHKLLNTCIIYNHYITVMNSGNQTIKQPNKYAQHASIKQLGIDSRKQLQSKQESPNTENDPLQFSLDACQSQMNQSNTGDYNMHSHHQLYNTANRDQQHGQRNSQIQIFPGFDNDNDDHAGQHNQSSRLQNSRLQNSRLQNSIQQNSRQQHNMINLKDSADINHASQHDSNSANIDEHYNTQHDKMIIEPISNLDTGTDQDLFMINKYQSNNQSDIINNDYDMPKATNSNIFNQQQSYHSNLSHSQSNSHQINKSKLIITNQQQYKYHQNASQLKNSQLHNQSSIQQKQLQSQLQLQNNKVNINQQLQSQYKHKQIQTQQHQIHSNYHPNQREFSILFKKLLISNDLQQQQLRQIMKLTQANMIYQQQKQTRQRIKQLQIYYRRLKIQTRAYQQHQHHYNNGNSNSQSKYSNKYKGYSLSNNSRQPKQLSKLQQLSRSVLEEKTKMNSQQTKIVLMNNYIQATKIRIGKMKQKTRLIQQNEQQYQHQQQDEYQYYRVVSQQQPQNSRSAGGDKNCQYKYSELLFDFSERGGIMKNRIEAVRRNIVKSSANFMQKQAGINQQKVYLKKQIQAIRLDIMKVVKQNKKYVMAKGRSVRNMKFASEKYLVNSARLGTRPLRQLQESRRNISNRKYYSNQQNYVHNRLYSPRIGQKIEDKSSNNGESKSKSREHRHFLTQGRTGGWHNSKRAVKPRQEYFQA